jgi:hypothetical protein
VVVDSESWMQRHFESDSRSCRGFDSSTRQFKYDLSRDSHGQKRVHTSRMLASAFVSSCLDRIDDRARWSSIEAEEVEAHAHVLATGDGCAAIRIRQCNNMQCMLSNIVVLR